MFTELQDAGKGINRLPADKGLEVLALSQSNIRDRSLPFCDLHLKVVIRPYPYRWKCTQSIPTEPKTVGEHLKRRRLLLRLFQSDLAKMFGVDEASIRNWEMNAYQPIERLTSHIIEWFGYDPRKTVTGRRLPRPK